MACEGIRQSFPLYLASAAEQAYLFGAKQGLGQEDDAGLVRLFLADDPHLVARAADREVDHSNDKNMIPTLVQFLNIVHTLAAVEALALGQKLGLFIKSLSSIIGTAAGSSESFKRVSSDVLECDFTSGPMIAQMRDHMVCARSNNVHDILIMNSKTPFRLRKGISIPSRWQLLPSNYSRALFFEG